MNLTLVIITYNFFQWVVHEEVWRGMFGAETLPALIFFILLFFVPQSPRWLTAKGQPDKAESILARVAGKEIAKKKCLKLTRHSLKNLHRFRTLETWISIGAIHRDQFSCPFSIHGN